MSLNKFSFDAALMSNSIPRNQPQLRSVLEENIASCLRRIDSYAVVCDDRTGRWWNVELFGGELENCGERRVLRHGETTKIKILNHD